ncbi:anhydro-N-acetylmuramic acid kinase [Kingella kingae]|uniref:anhydro-N-acetylmuramic acid kinase n=1 Tax=Kingella kingae TaxID=504 RepID=UPI00254FFE39|nr:anhydro-N-acetylmuramic acid kinase [Kingella kingae]MDK4528069.1 anhydro-N-acetylmuramic acid kinase [Kingella kingae]MDK4542678.1 anhydro-N-acetylmuramic acid kinase [Kingella kingae]MDK4562122.1 anhydro-N-acetylmuramic acid kinase [Kingella kingae]MDK4602431.1 anhydro-N-acetylmuramic acid kinase [Kingella kingae]MDK4632311.1 anhydro-N-acetylmuramic acid kinase [Kingella kingae]
MKNRSEYYIGIMSGTSMDGTDAVLIQMQGTQWQAACAHAFLPYPDNLKQRLLDLQNVGQNELHRSQMLAQELADLYAQVVQNLLQQANVQAASVRAIGCHGQTIRHAPECGYSIQLVNLARLAERTGIFTIGDFRSRDLAAGGQGAPLVPAFHHALFAAPNETRVLLNIGGIANISVLPPDDAPFGFDTGVGNMLLDAWTWANWSQAYDKNGERAAQGKILPDLLQRLCAHPYFAQPYPKSTGRELFSLAWLQSHLSGDEEPHDVLRTLVQFSAQTIADAIEQAACTARHVYVCGGGVANPTLMSSLHTLLAQQNRQCHSTDVLQLNPQWIEAAAFAWLAACWCNQVPSNPHRATGANRSVVLGAGYWA